LEEYKHAKSTTSIQEIFANASLQYKLFRFLNAELKYQYQKQRLQTETVNDLESFAARDIVNLFSQLNRKTGVVTYIVPKGGVRSLNNSSISSFTYRGQLNFNPTWKDHRISAILGAEVRQVDRTGDSYTAYGFEEDPLTVSSVDFRNSYKTFITGSSQSIPGRPVFSETVNRFVSMYSNISYTYKNKYSASASARRDGSNIFGVNSNDKWKPLWSAGAGWRVSDESFYGLNFLPLLRLRTTYGYSGNVDLSKSAAAVGSYSTAYFTGFPSAVIGTINNPELRWEKIGMFNVAADFSLKRNVLSGAIEYYVKKGKDLYGPAPIDYTAWGSSSQITKNVANMEGRGIEIMLNSKNIDKVIKWNSGFIFNYNTDKVTEYFSANANSISSKLGSGNGISPVVGKRLFAIAAYKWGGLDALGNPQGYVDGELSTNYNAISNEASKGVDGNIVFIGSTTPSTFGSLMNSLSWKNVTFSMNIVYKFGYFFRKSYFSSTSLIAGTGHSDFEKRWQKPGDEKFTNVPAFKYPADANRDGFYAASEINVLKADNIRLQFINLSYDLNKISIKRLPFQNLQLSFNAANLGIIWKANKEGIDPDYPFSLNPTRAWTFGIRGSF
jgi:hypothetical protein